MFYGLANRFLRRENMYKFSSKTIFEKTERGDIVAAREHVNQNVRVVL